METHSDAPSPRPTPEEVNPYAAPRAEIGASAVDAYRGDLAEIEAIRRAHLGHEASVKSIGSLHYLAAFFGALGVIGLSVVLLSPRVAPGNNSGLVYAIGIGFYTAMTGLNLALGIGLNRLQPWARWTDTALMAIGSLLSIWVIAAGLWLGAPFPVVAYGVILLIQGYILYLLLSKKGATVFSPAYREIVQRTPHIKYRTSLLAKIVLGIFIAVVAIGIASLILVGVRR